jgi:hypothetical protein
VFSTLLLQLIILFLPTQLGLHFWPEFSRAAGIRIDFLSPTLYFTDLLLLVYILTNLSSLNKWLKRHFVPCLLFGLFISLNTFFSISLLNTLFWWLRLLGYLLFFLCLRLQKISWSQIKTPLLFSTLVVIVVQIFQFLNQSSLGGIFYWLGERSYSSSTPGLARTSFFGQEILRAPSLFSHPNSLAGYLLVVYYLLSVHKSPFWQRILVFFSLLLTLSKGALLGLALVVLLQINSLLLIYSFLFISFIQPFLPSFSQVAAFISDRLFFMEAFKTILLSYPIFGVGLGSFIPFLADNLSGSFLTSTKLQPIHNLFLLSFSEIGILGVSLLVFFFYKKHHFFTKQNLLGLLAIICITGAFDHYWWTLPQNKLIILLATAILL